MTASDARGRSRSRSGTISPAPPPTSKRVNRAYTPSPSPERNVKPRIDDTPANNGDRTPPRPRDRERERSGTPPRPAPGRKEGRGRSPAPQSRVGGDDRWAATSSKTNKNGNGGGGGTYHTQPPIPHRGRSLSPLRRTRAQSPPDTPQYSLILPLPHSRIPSLLIGLKGASARNMQLYAGLNRLTFRGAGTGKGSNGNDPPICELRGSRRAIEDGLWAIDRKASSYNQKIDITFREADLIRIGGGGRADDERRPSLSQSQRDRERDADRDRDGRAPPPRRDEPWTSSNGDRDRDRDRRDERRDPPPARREEDRVRAPVGRDAPLGTADYTLEIPSLALSGMYSHLPKLRSLPGIDKITLKQGATSFIYLWGTQSAQDEVMDRVDEIIKRIFPSWRDAAERRETGLGAGWDKSEQPVKRDIARAGPIPDRVKGAQESGTRARSPPRRSSRSPPPSRAGRDRSLTPPRRPPPAREREASPDPRAIGRYVASLSEERRDEWTAAFVQASGLPYSEVKQEGENDGDEKMEQ